MFSSLLQFLAFNSSSTVRRLRRGSLFAVLALAGFGLSSMAWALLPPPPPDGGYPNGNTAEGENALFFTSATVLDR